MSGIVVIGHDGKEHRIRGDEGSSLMEAIRGGGVVGLLASCGGECSCATCHVYVEPGHFSRLPAMSPDEDALLSTSEHRTAYSRLSCQVSYSSHLAGLRLVVAPGD